mmetsp:Transcript_4384/g.12100  ORF Transcript_4384/g.12100 Transcript_4384/m.12100 type:complete len:145 (+) Transcript_4384:85-519(+)
MNAILLLLSFFTVTNGFVVLSTAVKPTALCAEGKGGLFQGISDFFAELDAFVDDASARRLGNGAAFYGKRKSNFYGVNDKNRKADRNVADPTEDYQGPTNTGMFMWMQDQETGEMKPVTRMKQKVIERNPKFWDRVYANEDSNE